MNTNLKTPAVLMVIFGAVLQLCGQGSIVPNGVTFLGNGGFGYETHVLQNPTNGNYTGFVLKPEGKTPPTSPFINTFSFHVFLDEGVRVFLLQADQPVSLQPILDQSYTELMIGNNYVFADASPFYVGLYTSYAFPQNGIYPDPSFGWAHFVNNQGAIEMLDSALEYGGGGIYAGTQTIIPVPEPCTMGLFGLGALVLGFHGWRVAERRK